MTVTITPWATCNQSPVNWGYRIHQLHLCREVKKKKTNDCPEYDTKQFDDVVPVMLELWGDVEHPFITIAPRSTWALEW